MIKCKPQAPYEVNGKCIECGGDKPLFSIDQQKCISCDQGRYYNS